MKAHGEDGAAVVEFVAVSVLLLVPAFYLILTLASVQMAAFAADGVAREMSRIVSETRDLETARTQINALRATAAHDLALPERSLSLTMRCEARACSAPGASVAIDVAIRQPLPLVPQFAADRLRTAVTVRASAVAVRNPYLEGR